MPEQQLDCADVGTGFEQVRRERVTQGMRGDGFADPGSPTRLLARQTYRGRVDGLVGKPPRKEPGLWTADAPVTPQDLQQPR